jgi:hypothetical protein
MDKTIWLEIERVGERSVWLRLDADANPIGTVSIPRVNFWGLYDADADHLWVAENNADLVPSMVRYRIRR